MANDAVVTGVGDPDVSDMLAPQFRGYLREVRVPDQQYGRGHGFGHIPGPINVGVHHLFGLPGHVAKASIRGDRVDQRT
jgi:hypothetical protein